ncbi:MAG TPA: ECF-type sigma factor [Rhodothermales bacterium]|nr:ECF-type sigma factor [Rhodothermales bacterium]
MRDTNPDLSLQGDLTLLLKEVNQGNLQAWENLLQRTYPHLCSLSSDLRSKFEKGPNDTLNTKALVHEMFLSLFYSQQIEWKNRLHFYMTAAKAMRYVLLNDKRGKNRYKRGGGVEHVPFDETDFAPEMDLGTEKLLEALEMLSATHPRGYQVVHLRFFLKMKESEIAEVLGLSSRTIIRDWLLAKALLAKYLTE